MTQTLCNADLSPAGANLGRRIGGGGACPVGVPLASATRSWTQISACVDLELAHTPSTANVLSAVQGNVALEKTCDERLDFVWF